MNSDDCTGPIVGVRLGCRLYCYGWPMKISAVVCDVGETLVDETVLWSQMADEVKVPRFTFMAVLGGLIAQGREHWEIWDELGIEQPEGWPEHSASDLYSDAVDFLKHVQQLGPTVGIAGNQPERATSVLRGMGISADFVASSAEWGVEKPSPEFFEKVVQVCGCAPEQVLYVGDRVDNDIAPASEAGLMTCHIRRGPWGIIQAQWPGATIATMSVDSLAEVERAIEVSN